MITITTETILEQLRELIRKERLAEKLLERASRSPRDPREVAHLWNLATECRDHARILSRHRRELDRQAEDVPYPSWPRGKGPVQDEALRSALEISRELAGDFRASISLLDDPYLRKFLLILSEEHDRRAFELEGMTCGIDLFEDIDAAE